MLSDLSHTPADFRGQPERSSTRVRDQGCTSGKFFSGTGKCLSTGGCHHRFLVEAYPILSDNLRHKESSAVASVLAQKMLCENDLWDRSRRGF